MLIMAPNHAIAQEPRASTPMPAKTNMNVPAAVISEMITVIDFIQLLELVRMDLLRSHRIAAMNFTTEVIEDLHRRLIALQTQEVC